VNNHQIARTASIGILLLSAGLGGVLAAQGRAPDWTQWRGPARDGAVASFSAPSSWPEQLTQKWKVPVGTGYATPLLVGNRLYVFSRQDENEVMAALDSDTGKSIWQTRYPASFTMHSAAVRHAAGPKSTPVFANGKVFSIGMTGIVTAFDAATGRQLWQKPGSDLVPMYTTHSFSPVVVLGMVIFHVGGHNSGALTAFDMNTGAEKWKWNGDGPGYGSPVVAELGGTRQIITITQGKVVGVDAETGALLWDRPYVSQNFTNTITPILHGQTVIISGNGGPTVAFTVKKQGNEWVTQNVWENADIPLRMTNAVLLRDVMFGMTTRNMGQYFSVDANTGKTLWVSSPRQAGNAAIIKAGDAVFSLQDDGELVVFHATSAGFEPLRRYHVAESETWTQPVISGNRVFVKDVSTLALWTLN
jgi:outer membrane protein assembly factor BamB